MLQSASRGGLLPGRVRGGICSRGGVCSWGVAARGGGVSAPGEISSQRVCSQGGVSQHALRQTPPPCGQNSLHTLVKILPWPNFVAAGNKFKTSYFGDGDLIRVLNVVNCEAEHIGQTEFNTFHVLAFTSFTSLSTLYPRSKCLPSCRLDEVVIWTNG